ncbi:hypothetical protein Tco_0595099 [Tanacetum coccineum]
MARQPLGWKVVEHVNHKKFSNWGFIVVEDDPDIIHVDNSSDLALTTSLNDMEIAALHIDGQSIDVDAPTYIIDVDEDDDIIDDEDVLPHDLVDFDDEDPVNVDDDDGIAMSADVARDHDDDGGGDDHPPPHQLAGGCRGHPKTQFRRQESRQDSYPQGNQEPRTQFDLKPYMQSELWPYIRKGIDQHLGKINMDNKSSLKRGYWVKNLDDETYDMEAIRSQCPMNISAEDRDEQIRFWSDPKIMTRCAQNARNRAKSIVVCRQRSRILIALRDKQMQSSATQEGDAEATGSKHLHSLSDHGHGSRGQAARAHSRSEKKQQAAPEQIDMITRAMSSDDRYSQLFTQLQSHHESRSSSGSGAAGDHESGDDEDTEEDEEDADKFQAPFMKILVAINMSSDDRYSQLFTQLQSHHESRSSSGSGPAGDHESGDDEDTKEDEEDADS